jgi:HEAT repeat protein
MSVRIVPLLLALFVSASFSSTPLVAQDVGELIRQLHREKDDAELALVEKVGKDRSRAAAEGLIEAYDRCVTLLFRREITKTLGWFANLPDSQQPALDKLAQIAGSTDDDEVRRLALRGLSGSDTIGKQLLHRIIASRASDEIRIPAMELHVRMADAGDAPYYRELWNLERKQQKGEDGEILPPEHNAIRLLAFEGLRAQLTEDELVKTLKREYDPKIRRSALDWMERSRMPKTAEVASWLLQRVDFPGADRAAAARILLDDRGGKAVSTFLKLAKKRDVTQADLRAEMARLIAAYEDDKVRKKVAKLLGKGKPHEKVFALQATVKNDDEKVLKAVRKQLRDKDASVRRAAAQALGARRDRASIEALRAMMTEPKSPSDVLAGLEALDAIQGPVSRWLKELAGYAASDDREVRNAALEVLGKARDKRHLEVMLAALAHADWSTRLLAIQGLAAMRQAAAVGPLVARLGEEGGRMRKQVAEALWRLTAQPFDEDQARWAAWWKGAEKDFRVATDKELDKADAARERRRLTQRTTSKAKFFGIRVESHRVIFVLDVSGSMLESMYGREVDGRGAARIDVAKNELTQAVENLEAGALFNIYAFSSGVERWLDKGIGTSSVQDRQEALTWIERLGAAGGTNLYDSVRQAFEDKDVDTIFILSDGEPTTGEVIDPHRIREDVRRWNKHRGIKINTIAIGGNLEVLEWLAKDAGGTYRQMR